MDKICVCGKKLNFRNGWRATCKCGRKWGLGAKGKIWQFVSRNTAQSDEHLVVRFTEQKEAYKIKTPS